MRDKNRMTPFLDEIKKEWERVPDWRFGQLMYNFSLWYSVRYGDSFYLEEDRFIEKLREYLDERTKQIYKS